MTREASPGAVVNVLLGAYAFARRTGALDTAVGQALFTSAYFAYKKYFEDPYARLVRARPELFRGGHILDVGANIGYTATVFARAVDAEYRVFAFEPEAYNFSLLQRTARSRAARGRIMPVRAAVGEADGTIALRLNPRHHGDHRVAPNPAGRAASGDQPVPLLTLDTFCAQQGMLDRVAFIKIDVQGYELAVCRGMRALLAANPAATVSLEYAPNALAEFGSRPEELPEVFTSLQYAASILKHDGRAVPADRRTIDEAVADTGYISLLFSRAPV